MTEFTDQVALVTGAGQGMGRALSLAFAAHGAGVAACDLAPINVDETVAQIEAGGGRAKAYFADVSKKLDLQTMLADWQRIDILVYNTGAEPHVPLLAMDEWDWRRSIDLNLTGAFLAMQSVGRVMRQQGGGVMLNIGPLAPEEYDPPRAAYLAARQGLLALTQAAAAELAPDNIRVNALLPPKKMDVELVGRALQICLPGDKRNGQVLASSS